MARTYKLCETNTFNRNGKFECRKYAPSPYDDGCSEANLPSIRYTASMGQAHSSICRLLVHPTALFVQSLHR